jgi:hypothetical protein
MSAIAHVQSAAAFATVTTGTTNSQAFPSNNTAGNCNVIQISCQGGITVSTVTDTNGNKYQKAFASTGNITGSAAYNLEYWVAFNIKAGANTVNVTYSGTITFQGDMSVHEYSGGPLALAQAGAGSSGNGAAMSTGSVRANRPNVLFFSYGICDNTQTVNAPWTQRLRSGGGGRLVSDVIVSTYGSEVGNATQTAGGTNLWVQSMVLLSEPDDTCFFDQS